MSTPRGGSSIQGRLQQTRPGRSDPCSRAGRSSSASLAIGNAATAPARVVAREWRPRSAVSGVA
eukprot:11225864-Lingulodinium_polyedra.AAC.1